MKKQLTAGVTKVGMLEDILFEDHIEHTYNIDMALKECKRVLKKMAALFSLCRVDMMMCMHTYMTEQKIDGKRILKETNC
jgi:ubiquinone/menaquinone biosynthesis C-methylase UbiE